MALSARKSKIHLQTQKDTVQLVNCTSSDKLILFSRFAGYVKVATIPKGARYIIFEEHSPSDNTLAVGPAAGNTYYLNGDL